MDMSILNKKMILILCFFSIFQFFAISRNNVDREFSKFEYDLADYLPHIDGRADVQICKSNKDKAIVDMYFYTSLYKVHYFIEVFSDSLNGYSEKIIYENPYDSSKNTKHERLEEFSCNSTDLKDLSSNTRKYIELALDLIKESLDSFM